MFFRKCCFYSLVFFFQMVPLSLYGHTQSADTLYTYIHSPGIGNIAVRIECPASPRYPEGAPVVVEVSTWFVMYNEFHRVNDTKRIGAVTVAYLWPGRRDAQSGLESDGKYDYGGPQSLAALKSVIRFASGVKTDVNGTFITDISTVPVITDNIGLFASSHAGVVATNVLACFGDELKMVKYLVGRENPTRDEMYPLELGYFDGVPAKQNRVRNPFYNEKLYLTDSLIIDYSTVGWYQKPGEPYGRPCFAAKDTLKQHVLAPDKIPSAFNKRYYSRAITRALLKNGALTLENWPDYLATPAETDAFWPYRVTVHNYEKIDKHFNDLKIMLVFSRYDHVQAAASKPHIHQAWDGFYHTCGLWTRMNPDRAYVQSIDANYNTAFPDNPANHEPDNWWKIENWGFPADHSVRKDVWLASVAEMADRVYMNDWNDDLQSVFVPVLLPSQTTSANHGDIAAVHPTVHRLLPNYPNPFNAGTKIPVELDHRDRVSLVVYNAKGRIIETLFNGILPAGCHTFDWHAIDKASGAYVYRLRSSQGHETQTMLLLK